MGGLWSQPSCLPPVYAPIAFLPCASSSAHPRLAEFPLVHFSYSRCGMSPYPCRNGRKRQKHARMMMKCFDGIRTAELPPIRTLESPNYFPGNKRYTVTVSQMCCDVRITVFSPQKNKIEFCLGSTGDVQYVLPSKRKTGYVGGTENREHPSCINSQLIPAGHKTCVVRGIGQVRVKIRFVFFLFSLSSPLPLCGEILTKREQYT